MNTRTYAITSSVIFFLVALGHLLRLVWHWDLMIDGWHVPSWVRSASSAFSLPVFSATKVSDSLDGVGCPGSRSAPRVHDARAVSGSGTKTSPPGRFSASTSTR